MVPLLYLYVLFSVFIVLGVWFLLPYAVRRLQARQLAGRCRKHRVVVLSFDDGPSGSLTPRVLDLLRQLGIRASFFLIGERALQNQLVVRQITDEGHELGSHTACHLNAWKSSPSAHCRDMLKGHRQVVGLVGETQLFRPPYGKMSLASLVLAKMNGLSLAWWTIDARDSLKQPRSHDDILARITAARGGVVLLHDYDSFPNADHAGYVLGLVEKIAALASAEGLRFATFSELSELASSPVGAAMAQSSARL